MRTLWIDRLQDHAVARHLLRAMHDAAALFPDGGQRCFDGGHAEVITPAGHRHGRRSGHHAADCLALMGKDQIFAHRPHVEFMMLHPAEHGAVEAEGLLAIAGVKLMPADKA